MTKKLTLSHLSVSAIGACCLLAFHLNGARIDDQGVLHEPFFLLPIGWLLLVGGGLGLVIATLARALCKNSSAAL